VEPEALLFDELARLRLRAGQPSYREIAKATGDRVSKATVHNMLHYHLLPPRWTLLEQVVQALGGDEQRFRRLWEAAFAHSVGLTEDLGVALTLDAAASALRKHGRGGTRQRIALQVLESEAARLRGLTERK